MSIHHEIRLGTRASVLATTQANLVADQIRSQTGVSVRLVPVTTEGDLNRGALTDFGGQGVFATALRVALRRDVIDVAVHSLKDLPTRPDDDLDVAAIPRREDARDALVARDGLTLGELPAGSVVGTGAPRRMAQLRALGFGLDVVAVRGNVETRLAQVASRTVDAVVVARAGLARLDRLAEVTEVLDPHQMLPAPGQGALAVECRRDDHELGRWLRAHLDDADTRACVEAERCLLAELEAGCSAPVGALAEIAEGDDGDELYLRGVVVDPAGSPAIRLSATGPADDPVGVGRRLALEMLDVGAANLLKDPVP